MLGQPICAARAPAAPSSRPPPRLPMHRAGRGELARAGPSGCRPTPTRLRADRADRARGDQQVEHGADRERADQADRHVALRVLGFFGRGRDRVEADVGEEDRGRRAPSTPMPKPPTSRRAGTARSCRRIHRREGQHDERGQRDDLDRHQHRVDLGALGVPITSSQVTSSAMHERGQVESPPARSAQRRVGPALSDVGQVHRQGIASAAAAR